MLDHGRAGATREGGPAHLDDTLRRTLQLEIKLHADKSSGHVIETPHHTRRLMDYSDEYRMTKHFHSFQPFVSDRVILSKEMLPTNISPAKVLRHMQPYVWRAVCNKIGPHTMSCSKLTTSLFLSYVLS